MTAKAGGSTTSKTGKTSAKASAKAGAKVSASATRASRQRAKRESVAKKPPLKPDLKVMATQVFRGPNYWSYEPSIRMLVDLGSLEEWPSNTIPGFNRKLLKVLPGVGEHSCSLGKTGGFKERLEDGTWLGHVAEHVALELQRESGAHISRGKTRSAGPAGHYNVIYGYAEERVGIEAGALAVRLVNHLVKAEPDFDFEGQLERLILLAERRQFGPSTQAIIDEALSRDIPWIRLNEHSLVQLGQGTYQQRIRATMTSQTSALAVDIAGDKKMTNGLLAAAGLPVPKSEVVRAEDDAVAAAIRIGFPVVTKPLDGNHGRGVGLELRTERAVRTGFKRALKESRHGHVVVESFVTGNDYRVLVIDGRMVAIAERVPARVTGDGRRTIRRTGGQGQSGSATRLRSREGAHPHQGRRGRDRPGEEARVRPRRRPREGGARTARRDRQHVHRGYLDRPHLGRTRGQRRDRRGSGSRRGPGRRGHRLPGDRHLHAGPRDRRCDRRGERGARVPHAHPPDRRRAAVRGEVTSWTGCSRPVPPAGSRSSR